jgi:hypothetical protein
VPTTLAVTGLFKVCDTPDWEGGWIGRVGNPTINTVPSTYGWVERVLLPPMGTDFPEPGSVSIGLIGNGIAGHGIVS